MYLEVKDLTVIYDKAIVLDRVSFHVDEGELVGIVGPNGAGKSTMLRAISGLITWEIDTLKGTTIGKITFTGSIRYKGEEILKLPVHEIARRKLILCPERGKIFREMRVFDNLRAGAYLVDDKRTFDDSLKKVYRLFPILKKRERQVAGTLSGGERTMLAIGRSLMSQAELLLIDEPSVGLAPKVKDELFDKIGDVHGMGVTMLLIEQDVSYAFELTARNYVLSRGHVVAEGTGEELLADELLRRTYLGL